MHNNENSSCSFCYRLQNKHHEVNCGVLVAESIEETVNQLMLLRPRFLQFIVDELSSQCLVTVKQVNDIPRLYRKTNREVRHLQLLCAFIAVLYTYSTCHNCLMMCS